MSKKALLVSYQPNRSAASVATLSASGFEVEIANSSLDAFAMFRDEAFDVVVCDGTKGQNGLGAFDLLPILANQQNMARTGLVIVTASDMTQDEARLLAKHTEAQVLPVRSHCELGAVAEKAIGERIMAAGKRSAIPPRY